MMIGSLIAILALAPWEAAEQRADYGQPAVDWAELLKPTTMEIGSRALAAFAVTRRDHHRRIARLWRPTDRTRVF
jgi:hypothetical protein